MKKIFVLILLATPLIVLAQSEQIKIQFCLPKKVNIHTKLIKDVFDLQKFDTVSSADTNYLNNKRFDSLFLGKLFSTSLDLLKFSYVEGFGDSPFFKLDPILTQQDIGKENYKNHLTNTPYNYIIAISKINSELYKDYYKINYIVTVYSRNKKPREKAFVSIYDDAYESSSLISCSDPKIECLGVNFYKMNSFILDCLYMDGVLEKP